MTHAALAYAIEPRMMVQSDLLGPLDVEADDVMEFAGGLYGFPEARRFVLLPAQREGLYWLQSADHSTLTFLLVDPFTYFNDYVVDLPPAELRELQVEAPADVAVLAIATLPRTRDQRPTANLQGPLALNLRAGVGKQLALSDTDYGVRCAFQLVRSSQEG